MAGFNLITEGTVNFQGIEAKVPALVPEVLVFVWTVVQGLPTRQSQEY